MYTLYGNLATFYPPYVKEHHPSISEGRVGFIIGLMYAAIILASLSSSILLQKLGRKNVLLVGTVIMLVGTAGYGLLVLIEDDNLFFWVSFIFRILQGFGDGCAGTAIFSIIAIEFKEEKALYTSLFSASIGLGALLGPMVGQLIFN